MADTQSILQLGIEAARAGEKAEARELFRLVTREDPTNAQGWLWLAGVAEHRDEKRSALERVIAIDPANELARKGLNALGVVAPAATAAVAPSSAPDAAATAKLETSAGDTVQPVPSSPSASARRARVYDEPELAYAPAGDKPPMTGTTLPAGVGAGIGAAAGASSARTAARPAAASPAEPRRTVPAEEEVEPRRRGLAWVAFPLLLVAVAVAAFFVYRNLQGSAGTTVAQTSQAAAASVAGSLPALDSAEASLAPSASAEVSAAGEASAPVVEASASSAVSVASAPSPSVEAPSASAPPPSAEAPSAAPQPSASAEASAAASQPAPSAAPEASPPEASPPAPSAAPEPTPPPPTAIPEPTAVPPTAVPEPTAAPPPPTAPGGDVASANPAVVANGTVINAGDWDFSYNGISNFATGPFGGAPPSRGRFEIVLITVRNTGNAAAQIPDGALVIKDGQGRVYDFNRAASVDYFNRFPDSGDAAADEQFPPSNLLNSVPLLFDVSSDATDLVLFSRDNLEQGFLIR